MITQARTQSKEKTRAISKAIGMPAATRFSFVSTRMPVYPQGMDGPLSSFHSLTRPC
jgi:hypothetical protein